MGWILIIVGIILFFYWSADIERGKKDPGKLRLAHISSAGCIPYIIAIILVIVGIILLL